MDIGQRIKTAREGRRLTQGQLGEQVGVAAQSVQQWEAGTTVPRRHRVERIAKALRCDENWLWLGGDRPNRPRHPRAQSDQDPVFDTQVLADILDGIEDRFGGLPDDHDELAELIAQSYARSLRIVRTAGRDSVREILNKPVSNPTENDHTIEPNPTSEASRD